MEQLILLALVGIGGLFALWWFTTLEQAGRGHVVVGIVLGEVVLEGCLYVNQTDVSSTLFYPQFAGQGFRLPQILIPLALLARVLAGRTWREMSWPGILWLAFCGWYGACFVVGVMNGNPLDTALFDAKAIVYIGGGYLLVSGAPVRKLFTPKAVGIYAGTLSITALVLIVINFTETAVKVHLPLFRLDELGFGSDASGSMAVLGVILLVVEALGPRPRRWVVSATLVMILAPIAGRQRAAVVEMLTLVTVLLVVVTAGGVWKRRVRLTGTQLGITVAMLVLVGGSAFLVHSSSSAPNPIAQRIQSTFEGEGKQQSADSRRQLWRESTALARAKPVTGWGLGKQALLRQVYPLPPVLASSHNAWLDLLIRAGLIGAVLFGVAVLGSLRSAMTTWKRARDPVMAALALGAAIGVVGLLAKGQVEPFFDLFRLNVVFGFLLGLIGAAARSTSEESESADDLARRLDAEPAAFPHPPVALVPRVFTVTTPRSEDPPAR